MKWVDEVIIEILAERKEIGVDELMEILWRKQWVEGETACSGWLSYKENGEWRHWCRQAEKLLGILAEKGLVVAAGGVVRAAGRA